MLRDHTADESVERIISASSNEGAVVLDPFCGCGTAVHAAEKPHRRWIGIDITHLSVSLIEKHMKQAFPYLDNTKSVRPERGEGFDGSSLAQSNPSPVGSGRTGEGATTPIPFEVIGIPQDFESAKNLAERDKYQFQFWVCTLVNAQAVSGGTTKMNATQRRSPNCKSSPSTGCSTTPNARCTRSVHGRTDLRDSEAREKREKGA